MPPVEKKQALTLAQAKAEFHGQLATTTQELAPTLPSHISPERFQRTVMTAINLNVDLLRADRRSLFNACAKAASDGLLPDGREGALVIFNTKSKDSGWVKQVQWMPMVAGIIKKARQSGEISVLGARIVYQNEIDQNRFVHKVVDGIPKVDHDPILYGDRGAPVLVYSFVRFKDGTTDFEFLHADDVAKIRAVSRSAEKGPWKDWPDEMWKKSAIRRHAKRLPVSSELFDTIARDDELTEFGRQREEAEQALLARAKSQLSAPLDGEVIDGEEVTEDESPADDGGHESPFHRGTRLLAIIGSAADLEDLRASISDELEAEDERVAWNSACDARLAEFEPA